MKRINIAIDGFSSCGKSTLAKALARRLHFYYLDTGAMYRAIGLYALQNNLVSEANEPDYEKLEAALPGIRLSFQIHPETGHSEVMLNEKPVEKEIREIRIAELASKVSKNRQVRNKLQLLQRQMAAEKGVIMDGRDIGTVVMPDAELKIYMVADPEVRAERRYREMLAAGKQVKAEEVKENLRKRDYDDTTRAEDPLKKADDAIVLDNSYLTQEEQLNLVLNWVKEKAEDLNTEPVTRTC